MVFSSAIFLFVFLPIVVSVNLVLRKKAQNLFLLAVSLLFYAWGEGLLVLLMLLSISINYIVGILLGHGLKKQERKFLKPILTIGIVLNLSLLIYYKYAHFIVQSLSELGFNMTFNTSGIVLPIGISFFTFQGLSYLIDVYREQVPYQKSPFKLGLYIALFPQLIAGPIIRYSDVNDQIENRERTLDKFTNGIIRFVRGLAKKVIIANNMALVADLIFDGNPTDLSAPIAWIGVLCYSLQIYFDFSGYSDMAIGLGRMFGFEFRENFSHPYRSKSFREFWRRWHISLSTWFRDYLYIPLGGNQRGEFRTYINLIIVFFLTGLWHGASWNFIIWGLFHGFFLIIERILPLKLPSLLNPLKSLYVLFFVLIGWVFFRAENLSLALDYLQSMFSSNMSLHHYAITLINPYFLFVFILGVIFSMPIRSKAEYLMMSLVTSKNLQTLLILGFNLALYCYTIIEFSSSTYNPFIYFRF